MAQACAVISVASACGARGEVARTSAGRGEQCVREVRVVLVPPFVGGVLRREPAFLARALDAKAWVFAEETSALVSRFGGLVASCRRARK